MNIGFDFDKIFINYPFFVPGFVIDKFYKKNINGQLLYRIPSKPEQLFRLLLHHPLFRQPIKENVDFLKKLASKNTNSYYLISSRFSFLKKTTEKLVHKFGIDKIFKGLYFNFSDEQPHLFKNQTIQKLKIDLYLDDDLPLLNFLAGKNPKTKFFWLNKKESKPLGKNLFSVKSIAEMFTPHQSGAGFK